FFDFDTLPGLCLSIVGIERRDFEVVGISAGAIKGFAAGGPAGDVALAPIGHRVNLRWIEGNDHQVPAVGGSGTIACGRKHELKSGAAELRRDGLPCGPVLDVKPGAVRGFLRPAQNAAVRKQYRGFLQLSRTSDRSGLSRSSGQDTEETRLF